MKVRKIFWRVFAILMIVCMLTQTVGAVGNTEYIIADCEISAEKAQLIIDLISGAEIEPTRNIMCLYGHSTAQTSATSIQHGASAAAPRCLRSTYDVYYCTRPGCNFSMRILVSQAWIHCCS
ncbi:MAG: hypothetical protein FWH20_07505 [Oscillospiraceae bacterium]|nr:hypothetical protein [Oscillospiraceae bacterium]